MFLTVMVPDGRVVESYINAVFFWTSIAIIDRQSINRSSIWRWDVERLNVGIPGAELYRFSVYSCPLCARSGIWIIWYVGRLSDSTYD
jgi:hypothetical protein